MTITFTSAADALEFTATANDDGTISAGVERPVSTSYEDDEYNDEYNDEYDDDEYDDDEDEFEYEGRDYDD